MTPRTSPVTVQPTARRIRARHGGQWLLDSTDVLYVWEHHHYPAFYVRRGDLVGVELADTGDTVSDSRGTGSRCDVMVGDQTLPDAAIWYRDSDVGELVDTVRLTFDAIDAWYEEDEPVYVHPRDPYTRISILPSSRHIRIDIDGVTVAESSHPLSLHETGLIGRWYLPATDVDWALLERSELRTRCPYKGEAGYWHVRVGDAVHADVAWSYREPLAESARIADHLCFYAERVDTDIDGVRQDRPATPFTDLRPPG